MMGKLDSKIAFIAGGAGNVGEGVVRSFLQQGATVITSSRTQDKLDALRESLGELASNRYVLITSELGDFDSADKLCQQIIDQFGRIDAVVASIGGTWSANLPLTKISMEDWQKYPFTNLTTHFVCVRTFLPVLAQTQGSSYIFLGGAAAEMPVPNYSLVAIPAAGQLMMAKVLMEELKQNEVRINEVVINSYVATRSTKEHVKSGWITTSEIGDYVAWLTSEEAYMVRSSVLRLEPQSFRAANSRN
jgi:NAD(P)-dependent dehydrogenase (short-subunit alcohol dehydrogenase family)